MNTIKLALLSTILAVAAGSAAAQTLSDRAEQQRMASEMNKPLTTSSPKNQARPEMLPPVSQADRRADEMMKSTDMMKPSTYGSSATPAQARSAVPLNAADQKMADTMRRSEMMKPN